MMREFRSDKNYLATYHEQMSLALVVVNLALLWLRPPSLSSVVWFVPAFFLLSSPQVVLVLAAFGYGILAGIMSGGLEFQDLWGIPAAVIITLPVTALLHCASHKSIRPLWLNRPVGELMGLIQLYGFADWTVLHFIHHSYSDDPELDPHPPGDKGYWEFTKGMRASAANVFLKYYMKHFGQSDETIRSAKRFARASKLDTWMKLVFWFLLLGPRFFATFYITSVAFKMLHYAWVNYSTHRPSQGKVEIQNLNHGIIYPLINRISFGLYFHKNHHLAPNLFNPRYLDKKKAKGAHQSVTDMGDEGSRVA